MPEGGSGDRSSRSVRSRRAHHRRWRIVEQGDPGTARRRCADRRDRPGSGPSARSDWTSPARGSATGSRSAAVQGHGAVGAPRRRALDAERVGEHRGAGHRGALGPTRWRERAAWRRSAVQRAVIFLLDPRPALAWLNSSSVSACSPSSMGINRPRCGPRRTLLGVLVGRVRQRRLVQPGGSGPTPSRRRAWPRRCRSSAHAAVRAS